MLSRNLEKALEAFRRKDPEASKLAHMAEAREEHRTEQGQFIKSIVYGGLDGIITTFAVVAGVAGAALQPGIVLILGFANLIADGISMAIGAACVISSIIGTYFVRLGSSQSIMGALYKGVIATGVFSLILLWPVTDWLVGMDTVMRVGDVSFTGQSLYFCGVVGLVVTALVVVITEYYTGTNYRPVQSIAKASVTGHGTNVIRNR